MSDTKHWITKLVPALAFAGGIIIASVGGIMTVSSSLKLALFETEPYSFISENDCRFDYNKQPLINDFESPYERTAEEVSLCIDERKKEELSRFQNNQKDNIVDGVSALLIGGILLLAFRRRK